MPTIIVEDGSVVTGANSYISVSDADSYHSDRGNSAWADATENSKQVAIVRSAQYLDSLSLVGEQTDPDNVMAWPRLYMPDGCGGYVLNDTVPVKVKYAQCEAALVELENPGELQQALDRGGRVLSETIDVISTTYSEGAPAGKTYPAITGYLRLWLKGGACVELNRG